MTVIHIVQFGFKSSVSSETINDVSTRLLDLKNQCLDSTTKQPYIKSAVGGQDHSIEGYQNGYTHAYVIEFESERDRDYYVKEDPAHAAFAKSLTDVVGKAQVLDITPGRF